MSAIVEARGVRKVYRGGDLALVEVLNHVDLAVLRGEVVAIVGASGAGKSTLLHLLGALDEPTGGDILLDGNAYATLSQEQRDELRNRHIGFVFQFHHLLPEFTALENVMMPLLIAGWSEDRARSRAEELLAAVDLAGRMAHRPAQLSGGEQQRCAVARALVHDPRVLLADEPSGNLDRVNSERLNALLFGLARELETSLIVVTHNPALAQRADRTLLLENGRLQPVDAREVVP
ncbi:MAG: ATP-binding cassette domain-containing protein [Gemmatimonadales bacterium]|nr:ATP-binding cassette domain-containing protein [Gemmatimonadales bacterium]